MREGKGEVQNGNKLSILTTDNEAVSSQKGRSMSLMRMRMTTGMGMEVTVCSLGLLS